MVTVDSTPFSQFALQFGLDPDYGYINGGKDRPLRSLPQPYYQPWEQLAAQAASLNLIAQFRSQMPLLEISAELLAQEQWCSRAHLLLSIITQSYIKGPQRNGMVKEELPVQVADPFVKVSNALGTKPIVTYFGSAMVNWQLTNDSLPLCLDNLMTLNNLSGTVDESWFLLVSTAMEATSGNILKAAFATAKAYPNPQQMLLSLNALNQELGKLTKILDRMSENCYPYIFYQRVRPYLSGWKHDPNFPADGISYHLTNNTLPEPTSQIVKFSLAGASGAQSPLMHAIDIVLGIVHDPANEQSNQLLEFRDYMISRHRQSLAWLQAHLNIRRLVVQLGEQGGSQVVEALNGCVKTVQNHRIRHMRIVGQYIINAGEKVADFDGTAPRQVLGTGGTSPVPFLKQLLQNTTMITN